MGLTGPGQAARTEVEWGRKGSVWPIRHAFWLQSRAAGYGSRWTLARMERKRNAGSEAQHRRARILSSVAIGLALLHGKVSAQSAPGWNIFLHGYSGRPACLHV